jgi:hypothetical protein
MNVMVKKQSKERFRILFLFGGTKNEKGEEFEFVHLNAFEYRAVFEFVFEGVL